MAELRAPGVYQATAEQRTPPLELGVTGVPVFCGITRRGPLDRPMRVTSEARFVEIFGSFVSEGYLGPALRGFFRNGGEECHVLRVARTEGGPDEDVAQAASRSLLDLAGNRSLRVRAQDPGSWGNQLRVTVRPSPEMQTFLTRDASPGETTLLVKSAHGLQPGIIVRLEDGEAQWWSTVTRVDGKQITLAKPLDRAFASAAPSYLSALAFDLEVQDLDRRERFAGLSLEGRSPRFVERVINEQSRLVSVAVLGAQSPTAEALPTEVSELALQGGGDGLTDLGPEDFIGYDRGPGARRGLMGLVDAPGFDLVAIPDLMAAYERSERFRTMRDVEAVQDAAVSLCERSPNRFCLLDPPPKADYLEVLRWRQQFDAAHAAIYFPWVVVLEGGKPRAVPPSGHIAGIYARSDREQGVHKAPANEQIEGIVDLDTLLLDQHLAELNASGINCMRSFAARGLRVWGARTLASDPEWRFLNVRRTISAISAAIEEGTQWVVFEPNGPRLWKRVSRTITAFLMGLRERGMLVGETPEDAFFVQCDAESNAPEEVDRGMLITRIGLAVSRPVEFIVYRLAQRLSDEPHEEEE